MAVRTVTRKFSQNGGRISHRFLQARDFSSPTAASHATSFGFRHVSDEQKMKLVGDVVKSVASMCDVTNDLMSLGLRPLWKDRLVSKLCPFPSMQQHLDVAGGTGYVAGRPSARFGSAQASPWSKCTSRNVHHMQGGDRGMLGTTVLCVRKDDKVIVIGDGQVTLGAEIIKPNVRKVRRIGENVIGGFAGATADSFTLFERLENKLEEHPGQVHIYLDVRLSCLNHLNGSLGLMELTRAAVELAKAWRSDKYLRRLDAVMVVADSEISLTITGNGDVLEPYDGVIGIGSGGSYASAAARALIDLPGMDAETIALKAMKIAADCCIYTNHNFTIERITRTTYRTSDVEREAAKLSNHDVESNVVTSLKEAS